MTDDPYQPPAAAIGKDPGSARPDGGTATATASLACGAGSVLFSWLPLGLHRVMSPGELITRIWLPLPAIVLAAASLILAIVGWDSARWPRAMFGVVLSILGVSATVGTLVFVFTAG